jgi:hypothetical protein
MPSRSFGLVFVMGSLFDKLRMYLEKMNQNEGEDSKIGVKSPGIYTINFSFYYFGYFSKVHESVCRIYFKTMNNLFHLTKPQKHLKTCV